MGRHPTVKRCRLVCEGVSATHGGTAGGHGTVPPDGIAIRATVTAVLLCTRSGEIDERHGASFAGAPPDPVHAAFGEEVGSRSTCGAGQRCGEAGVGVAVVQMPATAVVIGDRRAGGEPSQ